MLMNKKGDKADYGDTILKSIFNSLEEILIIGDTETGEIEYVSPNAETILGIRPEAFQSLELLLRKLELTETPTISMLKNKGVDTWEGCLKHARSRISIWCRCRWTFLETGEGRGEKLLLNIFDRSKDRASIERIKADLVVAQSSNAAKSRFLSTVSHDIRTPMNAIMGLTDLAIEHKEEGEKVQEYLYKISRSSIYLLSLINDVLDMSRIESGRMELDYESFQMSELLEEVVDIIRPQAEDKDQKLEMESSIEHDSVNGDPVRIRQVLINLLSNAVKYTQEGGYLFFQVTEITGKDLQDSLLTTYQMKVYDNGHGMSEEFLKIIFEPFEKERSSAYPGAEGTGLGMAITKSIVDLMDGNISVESRLGDGTVFTVDLPLQLQLREVAGIGKKQAFEEEFDCSGLRVLLVEDNEVAADVLKDILELMGAEVRRASNGQEAVSLFERGEESCDVVLMDIQMPIMDGYEATRQIRRVSDKGSVVPIIALTGNAFKEDINASKDAGMDRHISKPVRRKELYRILKELFCSGR